MGFLEAIRRSGWDAPRQAAAQGLCDQIRESLRRRDDFPADPDRVYKNLDSDARILDVRLPPTPASRLGLLDELLKKGPLLTGAPLKEAVGDFCRAHKREGPGDPTAQNRVLGRVFPFHKLDALYQKGEPADLRARSGLKEVIRNGTLDEQKDALATTELADELMWAFYDPSDVDNPYRSFTRGVDDMVDRLGLGKEWNDRDELVHWGHRLPPGVNAHTPTAWDGGADNPYWQTGGRTRPLSADRGGTGNTSLGPDDGLPEVVHDSVTGRHLAIRIAFLAN